MPRSYAQLKRRLVGRPIPSFAESRERLGKPTALAVLASDAISSTAYASEEILRVLVPVVALAALEDLIPIAIVVCVLLVVVISSYRQTIHAYPNGGGSYVVSRENLGVTPALVAGASLLVDYVLTAAVSVSAGVAAITSAYPALFAFRVEICVGFVALIAVGNLRGLRESGRLFAGPTFMYMLALGALIAAGLIRSYTGNLAPLPPNVGALAELTDNGSTLGMLTPFLLLRAFSSGAVALTGVEAISNGVPAFKKPESRNAATTLTWMGVILGVGFFGTALLAHRLQPTITPDETLLSILGRAVFGNGTPPYLILQFATFAILVLAANTAFADFPRLASIVARDGFLPRQFVSRGDRLVFSNGILMLAGLAIALLIVFRGDTSALIPLYAVGVFTGFTLSQTGMVRHHLKLKEPNWKRKAVVNGVGAVMTAVVLAVVVVSKFTIGAWVPVVMIPMVVLGFRMVSEHYRRVGEDLRPPVGYRPDVGGNSVVLLVGGVHRGTLDALAYARSLKPDHLHAVHVSVDPVATERVRREWDKRRPGFPLEVIPSPYRELTAPLLNHIEKIESRDHNGVTTVIIPDYVEAHWWDNMLHNQSALALSRRLRSRPRTVVVTVPVHAKSIRSQNAENAAATEGMDE
ncbi:APC family permease [Candidatus Neomicrothrix sp.]|jgi:amino acid transporter|uniref:APC family permease n=1 Tax=Candidatus Neomicrothrix subdominans TaxID=2954438 RepID=A0A936NCP5_9ACTN|nr:APC family permease [Candidatus Microthrix sp.]MBK9297249.1 APC family permease [Candidatus Microthrix subdominans]MBK6309243.1 APC family permease [Candidatus Microthrix sp.]MBK6440293.1 APC family permease [Candidatus Microthrix sp.]MBK6970331.1 APC family permease [Candidatus Microthrix sp.]MBK7163806.1 APC family permease [Candidatus Microthrix sp.]